MTDHFENMIIPINTDKMETLKSELIKNNTIWVVEMDGEKIQSWNDYIRAIQFGFQFPTPYDDGVNGYLDWIRDLDWLGKEGYVLIIKNYSSFIKDDPRLKSKLISHFSNTILPFWQDEVTEVVVEGKSKSFMVYLVD